MFHRKRFRLHLPSRSLILGERTLVMGVLNITPDSFSDGGAYLDSEAAIARALQLEQDGADIVDIGGESTRPGATSITSAEELRRILPVIKVLRGKLHIPMSVDTRRAEVAEAALAAGAEILNDVSGLRMDPRLGEIARGARAPLILMHMRGEPQTMQQKPFAREALKDVTQGLRASLSIARQAGVANSQIVLDPGIGFGKSYAQNYQLLAELPQLAKLGFPLLVGTSRKGFISKTLALDNTPTPSPRPAGIAAEIKIWGTAATVTASILQGAHIVRVHDVAQMLSVARIADCILNPTLSPKN